LGQQPERTQIYRHFVDVALAHSRVVVCTWLIAILACGLISTLGPGNITSDGFSVPGSGTSQAEILARRYIPSLPGTLVIVILSDDREIAGNTTLQQRIDIENTIEPLWQLRNVESLEQATSGFYHKPEGRLETVTVYFVYVRLPFTATERYIPTVEASLRRSTGGHVSFGVVGNAATAYRYSMIVQRDLTRAELIALPITFCILIVAFLSAVAAFLPILLAMTTLLCTLAIVHLLSLFADLNVFVVNTASAVALGLSVDYSLIIVTRFREERETADVNIAVARAMQTAGRAVLLSGLTVAALLPALTVVGIGLFTSIALGGIIASLIAVFAATTLLPATLSLLGARVEGLSFKPAVEASRRGTHWRRLANAVTRHPIVATLASVMVLLTLAEPALSLQLDYHASAILPHSTTTVAEYKVAAAFGSGATGLTEIVTNDRQYVVETLRRDPDERSIWREIKGMGDWYDIYAVLHTAPDSEESRQMVKRLRSTFAHRHISAFVGGVTAGEMDLSNGVAASLPTVVITAIVIALVMLFIGLRSIVIPLKAMACSALSVAATLGVLRLLFPPSATSSGIAFFVPLVTFVLVLGLSIDYEVFLLSRMREMVAANYSTTTAVAQGLIRTGRPISLAGLVVMAVFASFAFSSLRAVQQLGAAVTVGVLIDISIVRWILSPACVVLAGHWNWWFPIGGRTPPPRRGRP
jgi:uncharacterized membrane protein YdfJ with MMPL/SSD domain